MLLDQGIAPQFREIAQDPAGNREAGNDAARAERPIVPRDLGAVNCRKQAFTLIEVWRTARPGSMSVIEMFEQLHSNSACLDYPSAAVWFTPIHPWRKRRL